MARRGLTDEEREAELLTSGQVGILLGVGGRTVVDWARKGKIPYTTTLGGHMRVRRSDVEAILKEHTTDDRI